MNKFCQQVAQLNELGRFEIFSIPRNLIEGEDKDELYTTLLTNFQFIEAKIIYTNIQSMLDDYTRAFNAKLPFSEVQETTLRLIHEALQLSAGYMSSSPDDYLASQLYGRLMPYADRPEIRDFLQQIASREDAWLRPLIPSLKTPGEQQPLRYTLPQATAPAVLTADGRYIISASATAGQMRVWSVVEGDEEIRYSTALSGGESGHTKNKKIKSMHLSPDGRRLVTTAEDRLVKVWDIEKWNRVCHTFEPPSDDAYREQSVLAVTDELLVTNFEKTVTVRNLDTGEILQTLTTSNEVRLVINLPDTERMMLVSYLDMLLWNIASGQVEQTISDITGRIDKALLLPAGKHIATGGSDGVIRLWDIHTGAEILILAGHLAGITNLMLTDEGKSLLSSAKDGSLKSWPIGDYQAKIKTYQAYKAEQKRLKVATLIAHTPNGNITEIALFPNLPWAVSTSEDATVKLWNLETHQEIRRLPGHIGWMRGLAITPDGQKFIAPGDRWTLNLWHTESGEKLHTLRGHTNKISRVEITPDGQHAVSVSWDGTLRIWDLAVGRTTAILTGHQEQINDLAITPDGQHAVSVSNYRLKVWDLAAEKEIFSQQLPLMLQAVTVSPDGSYIIIGMSNGYSGVILLWNYVTGEQQMLTGHAGAINQLLVTPDSRYIISVSFDATIRVWQINTAQEICVFRADQYGAGSIALTADGTYLLSESIDNTIKIWDFRQALKKPSHPLPSTEVKNLITVPNRAIYDFRSISGQKELLLNLTDKEIARLNLSTGEITETLTVGSNSTGKMLIPPDENYLIVAGREISTWNLNRRTKRLVYEKVHSDTVKAVFITPDGKYGITASLDPAIKIWDMESRTVLHKLDGYGNHVPPLIAITPDGEYIIAGSDNFDLHVWQIATGQKVQTLQGHTRNITRVKLSADGTLAISASDDGSVRLWDLRSGQEQSSLPPKAMLNVQTNPHSVFDFALTPDNQYLVTISYALQPLVWHVPSAKIVRQLQRGKGLDKLTEATGVLTITPDGTAVVLYSNRHNIELFEIATGNYLYELETQLYYEEPKQWIWFSGGNYLLGRFKTEIRVWDMESRQAVILHKLSKEISDCVLTADEQWLIVTTMDGTVEILDLASDKVWVRFMGEAPLNSCGVTPDGRTIMAGGWHGDIHILHLEEIPSPFAQMRA